MRSIVGYIAVFMLMVSTFSCSSKGPKEIPLSDLKNMLLELVFMDTYSRMELNTPKDRDSLSVFQPILNKYGYTTEDIAYTFESLASRKSNVAVVLIEDISKMLDESKAEIQYMADLNKKWVEVGIDKYKSVIYENNELQVVKSLDMLDSLTLLFPINKLGEYKFSYKYRIDSTDTNSSRYFRFNQRDTIRDKDGVPRTIWLSDKKDDFSLVEHNVEIKEFEANKHQLSYQLLHLNKQNKDKKTNTLIYFDSVKLEHYPSAREAGFLYLESSLGLDSVRVKIEQIKKEIDEKDISAFYDKWRGTDSLSVGNIR